MWTREDVDRSSKGTEKGPQRCWAVRARRVLDDGSQGWFSAALKAGLRLSQAYL